ncbi:helix-turn-helix domain-containing protein [Algoriphagus sp. D3-2-R+10]|uniref:helix-turn-helix domain-containing protein n=1 Tax=Algoriphagus aurantiacus TaxID=3103948 RepID=UPI002B3DBF6A|nr:helix-turn-helix domain-containing protein [Algoriphagus sp. D3-2-R+10]MEB2776119.1 helix-turn-helix domain-containing protein [Algoriphagus sp. D3-2-R+10]
MLKQTLPTYQIPDFENPSNAPDHFYYSRLNKHLITHQFIQKPHKHDFFILVLFTQGRGNHLIDFNYYSVNPNSAFFLSPGQVHSWTLSKDTNGHILFFSSDFYTSLFPLTKLNSFSFFHSNLTSPKLELRPEEMNEMNFYMEKIESEVMHPRWASLDLLKSFTDILLTNAHRIYMEKNPTPLHLELSSSQFQKLELLIDSNFSNNREVNFYTDRMNMTLKQLNSLIKKKVGKTISKLIQERVMLEAKRLLVHSDLTISAIAFRLKFDDPSYFSRFFKNNISLTPEEFRTSAHHSASQT